MSTCYTPGTCSYLILLCTLQGDTDQHSLSNEPCDVMQSAVTTQSMQLGKNSSPSTTTKSSIPTGSYIPVPMSVFLYVHVYVRM